MSYLDWKVGDRVVCVEPQDDPIPPNPVYGEVYTVSWIGVGEGSDAILVDLVELPNPETEVFDRGYLATGFRKVQPRKTDISIFKAMLTPSKVSA